MYFGAHVSISPSIDKVPKNGAEIGAEVIQFFSQSPKGGSRRMPEEEQIKNFRENFKKAGLKAGYIHAPYFINLASKNNRIYYGSIGAIRKDLEIASLLGVEGVIMHLGSAKDYGSIEKEGKKKGIAAVPKGAQEAVVKALGKILDGYKGSAELFLEIAAGAGNIIGADLAQISFFLKKVKKVGGFCLDTAHAFESGLDLRGEEGVRKMLDAIEGEMGIKTLRAIHLNDSMTDLGSARDRHAHLGEGKLGIETIRALVLDERMQNKNFILETPTLAGTKKDLKLLKKMRKEGK